MPVVDRIFLTVDCVCARQGRQFQEALTALRADYQKRMRTVLDELDAEKKARLVMQVQLDRLDKLVKDMNFTV